MKIRRDRYRQGSIRRVKRPDGFAWEFRYYLEQDGKRVLHSQYFDGALYRTEKAVRQKVESQLLKLNEATEYARAQDVTFNVLLDRYIAEELPARSSTRIRTHPSSNATFGHSGARRSFRRFNRDGERSLDLC